ncbi:MAG: hypothetical protein PHG15_15055 [Acinetobacter sp.]|uniref:hypothetical protein n=1 Tax=Acinetobacter sp. TaxID=472 RepID=UPI00261E654A|nr:hypothetical protein [Acinetobacter sp.]MDD2947056.1 hypothetical protein [Acinetobacter sp.]
MKNNELLKKVEKVGYGIFTFFFWYLVIGFFLKSDYPIYEQPFNRADAYEVLKDGITLSAYILAPAIAVVLFSDWREEHASVKNEKISMEVRSLLNSTYLNMITLPSIRDEQQFYESIKRHFQYMVELGILEKDITTYDELSTKYMNKLEIINNLNYECWANLQKDYYQSKDESFNTNVLGLSRQYIAKATELKKLADDLQPLIVQPN